MREPSASAFLRLPLCSASAAICAGALKYARSGITTSRPLYADLRSSIRTRVPMLVPAMREAFSLFLVLAIPILVIGIESKQLASQTPLKASRNLLASHVPSKIPTRVPSVLPTIEPSPPTPILTCCSSCYFDATTESCVGCPVNFYCKGGQRFACSSSESLALPIVKI